MKKILSIVLVLCLAATLFTGCDIQPASVQITEAIKNTAALDSTETEFTLYFKNTKALYETSYHFDIQAERLNTDDTVAYVHQTDSYGQDIHTYLEGEWNYRTTNSRKSWHKVKIANSSNTKDHFDLSLAMLKPLPEDLLQDIQFHTTSDDGHTASLLLPEERFSQLYADLIQGLQKIDHGSYQPDETIVTEPKISITVKNGYVTSLQISCYIESNFYMGQKNAYIEASIKFKDPGKQITVIFPECYKDFREIKY